MTTLIKNALSIKFKELGSQVSYKDIKIHKCNITNKERIEIGFDFVDRKYTLTIKDYENIEFNIILGYDDFLIIFV